MRGPLNIARPVQGWPVIVQAGASEAGRQLAAETAEMVFASAPTLADGQRFYADVKWPHGEARPQARAHEDPARRAGRGRRHGARRRSASAPSWTAWCITTARSRRCRSRWGPTRRGFDPDGPLPEIPETNQSKSGRERAIAAGAAGKPDGAPACAAARRLCAAWRSSARRRPSPIRWRNGWSHEAQRRVQRDVPVSAGRPRRFRRSCGAGAAAARDFPPRVRRQDVARKHLGLPRPANRFFPDAR